MQNIKDYFSQLSNRDKSLLLITALLLSYAMLKFFVFDALNNSRTKLLTRSAYVQQQTASLQEIKSSNRFNSATLIGSDQIINNHLKEKGITDKLKQIRTTSSGEKRFEIENIRFDQAIDLLSVLKSNGASYSSLQIKNRNNPGMVNVVMTLPN